eukprot:TRINITY_DN16566_c0_g1_i3.p1 TRINITY_DN16566_c0_g1~~TRINITY_DN16566_c0_g1_i3.p1  ORF type:complete len:361 (+),score=64.58 TRINITY_DN16566_c0_g1_i3:105-1187(+)
MVVQSPKLQHGGAQMIGSQREYHASVVTKSTCHTLTLSRRRLGMIIPKGPERPWLTALKSRSEISYQSEVKYFRKRHLQQRLLNKTGLANSGGLTAIHDSMFMHRLIACWHEFVQNGGSDECDNMQETQGSSLEEDQALKAEAEKMRKMKQKMQEVPVLSGRRLCFSRQLRRTMLTCGEEGQLYSASAYGSGVVAPTSIAVPCRPRSAQTRPRPVGLQKAALPGKKNMTQAAQSQTGVLIQLAQKVQETKTRHIYRKECREEAMQLERQLQEMQEQKAQKETPTRGGAVIESAPKTRLRFAENYEKEAAPALDEKVIPRPRQPGRLDGWQTIKPAPWLQAVREEIPRYVGHIKVGPHKFL